jgi:uncharacterized protein YegP (UPF0339 family)
MSKTTILEVYKDKKGLYRFRLIAKNGEPVCASEAYQKKSGALSAAKKLNEWVSKSVLVDSEKKTDKTSKTTGKQLVKNRSLKISVPTIAKKVVTEA